MINVQTANYHQIIALIVNKIIQMLLIATNVLMDILEQVYINFNAFVNTSYSNFSFTKIILKIYLSLL